MQILASKRDGVAQYAATKPLCARQSTADSILVKCSLPWIIASLFILANCQVQFEVSSVDPNR